MYSGYIMLDEDIINSPNNPSKPHKPRMYL